MTTITGPRACAICNDGRKDKNVLYKQDFLIPNAKKTLSYDVVYCCHCGFSYADNIPSQNDLDDFYHDAEHHLHAVEIPIGLRSIHADFFNYIQKNIPTSQQSKVLDIGCSMGHFLNYFKAVGINNITGLEPSYSAQKLAKKHYDIDVISLSIDKYETDEKYNIVSLCGVLEHIEALQDAVERIDKLLEIGGYVFIAVPDVESFGKLTLTEPFLEFALEHINFFSKTSLENLFKANSFELIACDSQYYPFYNNNYLLAIFKKSESKIKANDIITDTESKPSVITYIHNSNNLLLNINHTLDLLLKSQEPIIVWGAGSFSTRLCATTRLSDLNLLGFVDKNAQLQGKTLLNRLIYEPSWIENHRGATIIIVSSTYAKQITDELVNKYAWDGKIIEL